VADQARQQCAQIEAPVEPVGEGTQVLVGILAELEIFVRADDQGRG
jgi:hypothetical protein